MEPQLTLGETMPSSNQLPPTGAPRRTHRYPISRWIQKGKFNFAGLRLEDGGTLAVLNAVLEA